MKPNFILGVILLLINSFLSPALGFSQNNTYEIFLGRSERYFRFEAQSKDQINILSGIVSIDRVDGLTVTAVANRNEFENFLKYGIPYQFIAAPNEGFEARMLDEVDIKGIDQWDFYPTYPAYESMMSQFQATYPELCTIINIGTLASGRKLLGAKITSTLVSSESKPQFLYSATIHGDETTGYILSLRLINLLLSEYNTNPKIKRLVDSIDIWVFPLANPDGTYKGGNTNINGATRGNANNVDLNRNYPDPRAGQHPDGYAWQQETLAFMALADQQHFSIGANMHGGAEVCNYPWDTWTQLAADDAWWINVCRQYADTAQRYSPAGYMTYLNSGITNGAAWYVITGGRQDYMNYFQNCREFTLELSNTKLLPAAQLPALWEYNYRSLLNYVEQALFGIKGKVTNSITGQPVHARVTIQGYDNNNSHVFSSPVHGGYFRYLAPGTYNVTFSAPCYEEITHSITLANRQTVFKNVQLTPIILQAAFTSSAPNIQIGQTVSFSDASCGSATSWLWSFAGGSPATSTLRNPQVTYNTQGAFSVSLAVNDGVNSHTLLKPDYVSVGLNFAMANGTITTCAGLFTDSGGLTGNYSSNENYTMTFLPTVAGAKIQVTFNSFDVEPNQTCNYDRLKVYNGTSITAPLIGTYCGTQSPGTIVASNLAGALTFQFISDASLNKSGWSATISCQYQGVGVSILQEDNSFKLFPNPVKEGNLFLECGQVQGEVRIINLIGQTVYCQKLNTNYQQLDVSFLQPGLYFLSIESEKRVMTRRFEIIR